MNTDTGEIRFFDKEDVKKIPDEEKKKFIYLTTEEVRDLEMMSFSQRLDWLNNKRRIGRKMPTLFELQEGLRQPKEVTTVRAVDEKAADV